MDLYTIARKTDERGNKEYQIGGNTPPLLAIQMIFEASVSIAKAKGMKEASALAALAKKEEAKKATEVAKENEK